ncbi:HNH endonuclease [Phycicoccus sp.]|uniref:HNH endonuclease n=1 Tax=Phycicoccus sp. TaxID=1902410 RepID=UPI002BE07CD2|nr:HNH endonuclease [Phycicoccus sp.]HMM96422.1 HNH endonuclease [Phycicoccus sp.]
MGLSRALVEELPETMARLSAGEVGEWHAVQVARETATLSREDRAVVDARLGPVMGSLSARALGRAARRVAAELDAASVIRRMEAAVASRRVSVRPAPDGMAYLSVLGPLREVVGAYAALTARAKAVVGGQCEDEPADGRAAGPVAADTALRVMAGLAPGQVQPVEVHLVMTDRALLGTGDPDRSVFEPARIPGHGSVPAPVARAWVRDAAEASVWLRRLYTSPGGRDLVAMDSRRRRFTGLLRRMLVLRDDVCTTPWCDAPVVHADHTHPVHAGGATSFGNGGGKCARCNGVKETPGWQVSIVRGSPPTWRTTHPTGHTYRATAPPLLGWGTDPPDPEPDHQQDAPDSPLERHLEALLDAAA